jgi:alkylhydroperoxidase family enzyme
VFEEPLHALIEKVAKHSGQVTDEDITAARASGLSEDQIFELVVCAAVGQATREYEIALLALTAVSKKE